MLKIVTIEGRPAATPRRVAPEIQDVRIMTAHRIRYSCRSLVNRPQRNLHDSFHYYSRLSPQGIRYPHEEKLVGAYMDGDSRSQIVFAGMNGEYNSCTLGSVSG